MSRTLSPEALKAILSTESSADLMILVTLTGGGIVAPIRLCNNYTQRISETADEVLYGTVSRGNSYIFLPLEIGLPSEESGSLPRANIKMYDVTKYVLPHLRKLVGPPNVLLEVVLTSQSDVVEASFTGLKLGSITYNKDTISADLIMEGLEREPFPCHAFLPSSFPGLF